MKASYYNQHKQLIIITATHATSYRLTVTERFCYNSLRRFFMNKKFQFLFILMLGLLGACGGTLPMPTAVPTQSATPVALPTQLPVTQPPLLSTPESAPTLSAGVLPDDVLLIYHRSGGIAGIDETLTVYQGGQTIIDERGKETSSIFVDHAVIQPLRRIFEAEEFAELGSDYTTQGADLITYTITARDKNGNVKTIVLTDGAALPDYLAVLLITLEQLRQSLK
jgi:hypothetical protein